MKYTVIMAIFCGVLFSSGSSQDTQGKPQLFEIKTTSDNQPVSPNEVVYLMMSSNPKGLSVQIKAPFYHEKSPPAAPGLYTNLANYQQVLLLFLATDSLHCLQVEFGPGGHYAAYFLNGLKIHEDNATAAPLPEYAANVNQDGTWTGKALIPNDYFPIGVNAFNAYSIHGESPNRRYLALFPGAGKIQNIMELLNKEHFQNIDLKGLIQPPKEDEPKAANANSGSNDEQDEHHQKNESDHTTFLGIDWGSSSTPSVTPKFLSVALLILTSVFCFQM